RRSETSRNAGSTGPDHPRHPANPRLRAPLRSQGPGILTPIGRGASVPGPWDFLPAPVRKALDRLGFAAPTPVQSACLPKALAGESFRAVAPTGTGKTLVYMLPAWKGLERKGSAALILLPTRELAYQVSQMLQAVEPS